MVECLNRPVDRNESSRWIHIRGNDHHGSDVRSGISDQLGAEKSVDNGINVIRWYKMDEDFWMRSSAS